MAALFNSEFFRIFKRPMLWWMLLIVGGFVVALYAIMYFANNDRKTTAILRPSDIPSYGLYFGSLISSILATVLGAQLIGSEYTWGTIRALVSRASGRVPLMMAKILVLALLVVVLIVVTAALSLAATVVISSVVGAGTSINGSQMRDLIEACGRQLLVIGFSAALAFAVTVLTRSTAAGIAVALAVNFLEGLVWTLLQAASDTFSEPRKYFPDYNTSRLITAHTQWSEAVPGGHFDLWRGALVIACWIIGLLVIGVLVFRRRDITSG